MRIKLKDCLNKHGGLLGPDGARLGKREGCCFWNRRQLFLSYSKKNGWDVVRLNAFQIFLRTVCGNFSSTHLDYIQSKIAKMRSNEELDPCIKRIQQAWNKKFLTGLGNSPLSQAKVVAFAEDHTDMSFRSSTRHIISQLYREGDLILIEGQGSQIEKTGKEVSNRYPPHALLRGWEPESFNGSSISMFEKRDAHQNQVHELGAKFRKLLEGVNTWTESELTLLGRELEELGKKITALNLYYRSRSPLVLRVEKNVQECFEKLKAGTLSKTSSQGTVLLVIILKILVQLEKRKTKATYANATREDLNYALSASEARNASLASLIAKERRDNRRIFVIAGAAHLLDGSDTRTSCKIVKEALKQDRFVIVTRGNKWHRSVAWWNRDLRTARLF